MSYPSDYGDTEFEDDFDDVFEDGSKNCYCVAVIAIIIIAIIGHLFIGDVFVFDNNICSDIIYSF